MNENYCQSVRNGKLEKRVRDIVTPALSLSFAYSLVFDIFYFVNFLKLKFDW